MNAKIYWHCKIDLVQLPNLNTQSFEACTQNKWWSIQNVVEYDINTDAWDVVWHTVFGSIIASSILFLLLTLR